MELSNSVSHFVRPDVKLNKDTMDIGAYVHIKKVGMFYLECKKLYSIAVQHKELV